MLYTEILDQEIFVPPINEIRNSHDRIMQRILDNPADPNMLDKAMSSLQNGVIQSLDFISIGQLEYVQNLYIVDKLESNVVEAICPGTQASLPEIMRFQEDVQKLKLAGHPVDETALDSLIARIPPIKKLIEDIKISKIVFP